MKKLNDRNALMHAIAVIPEDAPKIQVDGMRDAFMAGAAHLFSSIMLILEEGEDATPADMARMEQISDELERFGDELKLRCAGTGGRA